MSRQLLARATEASAAPTPGYLYKDLAQAASSNPTAAAEMANYLTARLGNKQNPNVKYKCLKVIAKLCEQVPRNQFRRCISQNPHGVSAIKEAVVFRGPPDPVRGDEPNAKVRQAAQEALDAVYREASTSELAAVPSGYGSAGMAGGGGMAGASYGPPVASAGGGGSGGGGTGRRMEGIGNPRYQDPRLDPRYNPNSHQPPATIGEAVRGASEIVIGMIKDPLARNVNVDAHAHHQMGGGMRHSGNLPGYGNYGGPPPGSAELSRQTGGQWTMASNRGPGSVTSPGATIHNQEYYKARDTSYNWAQQNGGASTAASSGGVGGSWASAATTAPPPPSYGEHRGGGGGGGLHVTPPPPVASAARTGTAASDGVFEKNLVMELCPPGGMKAVPPPDKLAHFAKIVSTLNSDLVCPVLLDCLEEGQPWLIRAKALCVMETCVKHGARSDGSGNPYRDFFHACQDEIRPLVNHTRSAIRDPARRILQLLGIDGSAGAAAAAAPPVAAPPPNLLDFDDAPAPAPVAPPPAAAAAPPAAAAGGGASLFGGMQVKASPAVAAAAPVAAAPAAATTPSLLDFGPAPPAAVANTAPSSMFAQMNLKDSGGEDKKADSEDAGDNTLASFTVPAAGSNTGSAFGFINETTTPSQSKDEDVAAAPPAQPITTAGSSSAVFDPLLMTPNAQQQQKKTMTAMTMSPEQMKAMAYQQQAYMMQQQMQAMAYMQQQQKMGGPGGPGGIMFPPTGSAFFPPQNPALSNAFRDAPRPAQKDDKKFDFVKDAMQQSK